MSTEKENLTLATQAEEDETSPLVSMPVKMRRFVELYMTGLYTVQKLAQLLEVHPNTCFNWLRKKEVKDAIALIQEGTHQQVQVELKALTLKATQKLHQLMDSPIDGVALQAVKDVLDRAGHKQKQEIKIDKTVTTVEQKMKELIDNTIDVEYEVID
jgi:transposase-like protein